MMAQRKNRLVRHEEVKYGEFQEYRAAYFSNFLLACLANLIFSFSAQMSSVSSGILLSTAILNFMR